MTKIKLTKEQWNQLNCAISIAQTAMTSELGERHPEWKEDVKKATLVLTEQMRLTDA
jgi:hypothetical protein